VINNTNSAPFQVTVNCPTGGDLIGWYINVANYTINPSLASNISCDGYFTIYPSEAYYLLLIAKSQQNTSSTVTGYISYTYGIYYDCFICTGAGSNWYLTNNTCIYNISALPDQNNTLTTV
jgi:hypothetical protein